MDANARPRRWFGGRRNLLFVMIVWLAVSLAAYASAAEPLGLAPPLDHWVFKLPNEEQTKLVSIAVSAVDHTGDPAARARVLAYCEPCDYTTVVTADDAGRAIVRGPVGDWTFVVGCARPGKPGILAAKRSVRVDSDRDVKVAATDEIEIRYTTDAGKPFLGGLAPDPAKRRKSPRAARLSFVPTCLPAPVKEISAGFLQEGSARLSVTPDLKGFMWLVTEAEEGASAYVILHSFSTDERPVVPVNDASLSHLLVKFDGYPKGEIRAVVNFTPVDREAAGVGLPVRIPSSGRACSFMVTPGAYRVSVSLPPDGVFVPHTFALAQGSENTLHYGSKFEARLNVLRWGPKMLELWFDVTDDRGNCLHQVAKSTGTLRLTGGAETLYDGPGVRKSNRHFKIGRNWGPPESHGDVGYEYVLKSDFLGSLARRGVLPTDPKEFLPDSLPVTFASPWARRRPA